MNVDEFVRHLADPDFEGCADWLYCDSRGFVTTGIGNMVQSPDACARLPFCHLNSGDAASDAEKRDAWKTVADRFQKGASANAYRSLTDLRLGKGYVYGLAAQRVTDEFIPGIKRLCHEFDTWPEPAQWAVVDMAYNMGVAKLASFVNMLAACQARDWVTAAEECHRATCRDSRNAWTKSQFEAAAQLQVVA